MKRTLLCLLLLAVSQYRPAIAQDSVDETGRGVARISVINGDVSVRRGDSGDWIAGAINAPLVAQDSLLTGAASRSEVQFDWANMIRLAANTEVRFSELEFERYQVQVARGTVTWSVIRETEADVDLSTPNVSVRPLRKGRYRITVRDDGNTEVTIRKGEAEIYTPQGVETLRSGKSMLVRGPLSNPEFQVVSAFAKDDWDRWNENRDKDLRRSTSYNYVSRDIYGAEDLDGQGRWIYDPAYGWVWAPQVAPGWAPYRYGRWSWVDWYGWSWISYDPWGWAPYHYGRWYRHPSWGWCGGPGGRDVRHYWSPGLVAFFGWGGYGGFNFGVSIGFGFGHVGWVPLAPYERYNPWYGRRYYHGYGGGHNRTYIDNSVNIVNNTNIINNYRNARKKGGVTAVEGGQFGRGRVNNVYDGNQDVLRKANLVRGQVPVVPQNESQRFSDRPVRTTRTAAVSRGRYYSRRQPRSMERASFSDQQHAIEQVVRGTSRSGGTAPSRIYNADSAAVARTSSRSGRSTSTAPAAQADTGRSSRATRATAGAATRATAGAATRTNTGWRRFGEPTRTSGAPAGTTRSPAGFSARGGSSNARASTPGARSTGTAASGSSSRGWRRFGEPSRVTSTTPRRSPGPRAAPTSRSGRGSGVTSRSSTGSSSRGWRRFDPNSSSRNALPSVATPSRSRGTASPSTSRSSARSTPSYRRSTPSRSAPSYSRSTPSRSTVRVSPPIVRPRSGPSSVGRSSAGRSSPSYSRGSSRSAPPSSRGSFGSGRSSAPSRSSASPPSSSRSGGASMRSAPSSRSGGGRSSSRSGGSRSGRRR